MRDDQLLEEPAEAAHLASATMAATLRGAMHVAFSVLPAIGAVRAISVEEEPATLVTLAATAVIVLYVIGSRLALRRGSPEDVTGTDPLLPSGPWVLALTLAWMAATVVSSAFVWIAFPLFFLVLFALGPVTGPLALAGVTLWAIASPLLAHEQWGLGAGEILGPLVGAVFSVIAHAVFRRLLRETERSRALVARLRAAQAELADSERRKGVAEERQRLAQDIHDTLAQGLNSIVLMSRGAGAAHPSAAPEFARIEQTARDNLADARQLVSDLADRVPRTGLEQALRDVIGRAREQGAGPAWELRVDGTPRELDPEQVETLQRAAQSLVANVQQHAEARHCVLTLAWWPDRVSLDVVDDGRGFDPAAPAPRHDGGHGLRLLRARLTRAGGAVTIDSAPGEGTTIGLTLPTTSPTTTQEVSA